MAGIDPSIEMLRQATKRNAAVNSEGHGLREVSRLLRRGGQLTLAFTTYSGQQREGVPEFIAAAGFSDCRVVETDQAFCVLASAHSNDSPDVSRWPVQRSP